MDNQSRHLLKIGIIANVFEWYEFFIFASLTGIIGKLFFSAEQPIIGLIYGYLTFAVGFIARPLGGLFFGYIGDRIGRSVSLRLSLILMAIPTVLIGVLPTHQQIGFIATATLFMLRLTQGFAAGGELPMTACYVFESSPSYNKSFLCSVIAISPKLGMLLATLVNAILLQYFDEQALMQGAWRIPFLLGMPLTLFIVYLRRAIEESAATASKALQLSDLAWEKHAFPLVKAVSLVSFGSLYFYLVLVWMRDYLVYFLEVPSKVALFNNTATICLILPLYFFVHYAASYFGYRKLLLISLILMVVSAFLGFKALQFSSSWQILLSIQFLLSLAYVGFDGVLIETLGDLFPSEARSLSFGIAWTLAAAFIGGTAPLICTYVIHKTNCLLLPVYYVALFGILALPTAIGLTKHKNT